MDKLKLKMTNELYLKSVKTIITRLAIMIDSTYGMTSFLLSDLKDLDVFKGMMDEDDDQGWELSKEIDAINLNGEQLAKTISSLVAMINEIEEKYKNIKSLIKHN